MTSAETIVPIERLRRDVRAAAQLTDREARFLVDAYYTIQTHRIEAQNQVRSLGDSDEPSGVLAWLFDQHAVIEAEIRKVLGDFANQHVPGVWARSITGIGPVLSAGLLAHIDIEQAPTVGHIWRFGGYDPTVTWEKGEKRPWNAALKVLFFKIGESFVKVSGNDSDVYGKVYAKRKALEIERNEAGLFADQAAAKLEQTRIGKNTDAFRWYAAGKLPPARIHARAKRYAVKLFLSAYHEVAFFDRYGELPPKPYAVAHLGHAHYMGPPNVELVPGLVDARRREGLG